MQLHRQAVKATLAVALPWRLLMWCNLEAIASHVADPSLHQV